MKTMTIFVLILGAGGMATALIAQEPASTQPQFKVEMAGAPLDLREAHAADVHAGEWIGPEPADAKYAAVAILQLPKGMSFDQGALLELLLSRPDARKHWLLAKTLEHFPSLKEPREARPTGSPMAPPDRTAGPGRTRETGDLKYHDTFTLQQAERVMPFRALQYPYTPWIKTLAKTLLSLETALGAQGIPENRQVWALIVVAPTAEKAREGMEELLQVCGEQLRKYTELGQKELPDRLRALREQLQTLQADIKQAAVPVDQLQAKIDNLPNLDAKLVGEVKTQQCLLNIDLAGLMARRKALASQIESLRQSKQSQERISQLEMMQIGTEVDLVQAQAKMTAIEETLNQDKQRAALLEQQSKPKAQLNSLNASMERTQSDIARAEGELAGIQLPLLVDNQVTVHPVAPWQSK